MTPLLTIAAFRAKHIHLFLRNQDWFVNERFMDARVPTGDLSAPVEVVGAGVTPGRTHFAAGVPLPSLAELVGQYVQHPTALVWKRYLWTSDVDRHGQRVYIGDNGYGLEIHRHLTITPRWGCPSYRP